jgi:hypothetical protein
MWLESFTYLRPEHRNLSPEPLWKVSIDLLDTQYNSRAEIVDIAVPPITVQGCDRFAPIRETIGQHRSMPISKLRDVIQVGKLKNLGISDCAVGSGAKVLPSVKGSGDVHVQHPCYGVLSIPPPFLFMLEPTLALGVCAHLPMQYPCCGAEYARIFYDAFGGVKAVLIGY